MRNIRKSNNETPESSCSIRLRRRVLILLGVVNICYIPLHVVHGVGLYWTFGRKEKINPTIWFLFYVFAIPMLANSGPLIRLLFFIA